MKKYPLPVAAVLVSLIGLFVWLWPESNPAPAMTQGDGGAGSSFDAPTGPVEVESSMAAETAQEVHRLRVGTEEHEASSPTRVPGHLVLRSSSGLPVERVTVLHPDGSERAFLLHTPGQVALEWLHPGSLIQALGHSAVSVSGHEEELLVEPFHELRIQGIPSNQALPFVLGLGNQPAILESQGQVCGRVDGDWVILSEQLEFNPPFYRISVPGYGAFALSLELKEGKNGKVPWSELVAASKPNLPVTFEASSESVLEFPLQWRIMLNPPEQGQDRSSQQVQWKGEWGVLRQSLFSGTQVISDGATVSFANLPRGWSGRVVCVSEGGQFGWHAPFRNEGGILQVELQTGPRIEGRIHLEGQRHSNAKVELGIEFMKGSVSRLSFQTSLDGLIQHDFPLSSFEAGAWSFQGVPETLRMTWKSPGYEPYSWMQPLDLGADVLVLPAVSLSPVMAGLVVYDAPPILDKGGLRGVERGFTLSMVQVDEEQGSQKLYLEEAQGQAAEEPYLVAWSEAGKVFLKREGSAFRAMSLVPYRIKLSRETAIAYLGASRYLVLGGSSLRVSKLDVPLDEREPVVYEVLAPKESVFLLFESKEGEGKLVALHPGENSL